MTFDANGVLLNRNDNGDWVETVVPLGSVADIRGQFTGVCTQVNISKYEKLYYTTDNCDSFNSVLSKITDYSGEVHYMFSPLLLVQCDDEKPVKMTTEILENMKKGLELY